jgi:hypothetical protein
MADFGMGFVPLKRQILLSSAVRAQAVFPSGNPKETLINSRRLASQAGRAGGELEQWS